MSNHSKAVVPLLNGSCLRRKESTGSGDYSIEELFPDDMGYDADVEVIRPDHYQEPDSDSESASENTSRTHWRTIDEELAERMHRLGREYVPANPQTSSRDRGRKRTSWEVDHEGSMFDTPLSPEFEVQEMVDKADQPSPAKRRRKKCKSTAGKVHPLRNQPDTWTDSSEKGDAKRDAFDEESGSSSPATSGLAREDAEPMDIT